MDLRRQRHLAAGFGVRRTGADGMLQSALARTEEAVQMALDEIKQSRVRFRNASAAKLQEQREKLAERGASEEHKKDAE